MAPTQTTGILREIIHQPEQRRFLCRVESEQAVLYYRHLGKQGVDFHHTHVPEPLRGRGIAEALVREGLSWARREDMTIAASCWYVARWLRD